jgi:hypothetical protein
MQIPSTPQAYEPISSRVNIQTAANAYLKHSQVSTTNTASKVFASVDAEIVHDLKKLLIMAIDCGDFDKAIYILNRLKELGSKGI